jgi:predicted nucleic acid-binding protein
VTILTDTNVLVALMNEKHEHYGAGWMAVYRLLNQGHRLAVSSQNLVELWGVCSRPARVGGLGLSLAATALTLDRIEAQFARLEDLNQSFSVWRRLVREHGVSGRQVHDAHLVASMLAHGVTHILTFNGRDFVRYREIEVIDPHQVE